MKTTPFYIIYTFDLFFQFVCSHYRFYVLRLSDTLYPTTLPNVALDRFCYSLYRESYFISREKNQACFIHQFPNSCSMRGSTLNYSPKSKRKRKLATSTAAREKALDDRTDGWPLTLDDFRFTWNGWPISRQSFNWHRP